MFLEPQSVPSHGADTSADTQRQAYYNSRPTSQGTHRRGSLAVRSLRRSISGESNQSTPRAVAGGYEVSADVPGQATPNDVVTAPGVADDFVHEMLAMNTVAMQRCRAGALEESLSILGEAYARVSECIDRGGNIPVPAQGDGTVDGNNNNMYTNTNGGAGEEEETVPVDAQLLDQLKATTLNNMGVVECHRGQPRQALSHFEGARQLEEHWNVCSPSVALNSCAAYNALNMHDKATAAALETIDMLRTLELQKKFQAREKRRAEEEQQLALAAGATDPSLPRGAGGEPVEWEGGGTPGASRRGRSRSVVFDREREAAKQRTGSDARREEDELAALAAAGQPAVAASDNQALWGAAWHNLAVAQINTARRATQKGDVSSEFSNSLRLFQNAMKATQELLGAHHPMTKAVTETYRAVRTALRDKGAFSQHRTLMTAPPIPADPREREAAAMAVEPAHGRTRHATLADQEKNLTITFRGAVTRGEKLVERLDSSAYPGATEEVYRRGGKPKFASAAAASDGRKKKKKSRKNPHGSSAVRGIPLGATLSQAASIYGNPHPLLYSPANADDAAADANASYAQTWSGSKSAASSSAPAAPRSNAAGAASHGRAGRAGGGRGGHGASGNARPHHLPQLTSGGGQQRPQSASGPGAHTVVDQTKLLLLAQPPVTEVHTHYFPIEGPPPPLAAHDDGMEAALMEQQQQLQLQQQQFEQQQRQIQLDLQRQQQQFEQEQQQQLTQQQQQHQEALRQQQRALQEQQEQQYQQQQLEMQQQRRQYEEQQQQQRQMQQQEVLNQQKLAAQQQQQQYQQQLQQQQEALQQQQLTMQQQQQQQYQQRQLEMQQQQQEALKQHQEALQQQQLTAQQQQQQQYAQQQLLQMQQQETLNQQQLAMQQQHQEALQQQQLAMQQQQQQYQQQQQEAWRQQQQQYQQQQQEGSCLTPPSQALSNSPRDRDVIWKSVSVNPTPVTDSPATAAMTPPSTSQSNSLGYPQPTPPPAQGRPTPTPPQQQQQQQQRPAGRGGAGAQQRSTGRPTSGGAARGGRPTSAGSGAGSAAAGNRRTPSILSKGAGARSGRQSRLSARDGNTSSSGAATPAPAPTGPQATRELFDAVWVTADTHYVRSGNRITARCASGGDPNTRTGPSAASSVSGRTTTATTAATSPAAASTRAVMRVDEDGNLAAMRLGSVTPKSSARRASATTPQQQPQQPQSEEQPQPQPQPQPQEQRAPYNVYVSDDEGDIPPPPEKILVVGSGGDDDDNARRSVGGASSAAPASRAGEEELLQDLPSNRRAAAPLPMAVYDSAETPPPVSDETLRHIEDLGEPAA